MEVYIPIKIPFTHPEAMFNQASHTFSKPIFRGGSGYSFGFNGQEKDDEVSGAGNTTSATYWEYDARLGRRWNIDPKPNPSLSVYSCFANNPIWFNDVHGDTIGINLFGPEEPEYAIAQGLMPTKQENDGIFVVFAHANNQGVQYRDKGNHKQKALTPAELNTVLSERSKAWKDDMDAGKKMQITLVACNTSSPEYYDKNAGRTVKVAKTFAQRLSDKYENLDVIGANGFVLYGYDKGKPHIWGVRNPEGNGRFSAIGKVRKEVEEQEKKEAKDTKTN